MSQPMSVKVSSRYQVVVPRIARERLNIQSGDRLLVDVQDGVLILIPQPQDPVVHLAGLHKEIWAGVDTTAYLQEEREAWNSSGDN
jgi:AbrB family looped-hinge helix DNA binding protein